MVRRHLHGWHRDDHVKVSKNAFRIPHIIHQAWQSYVIPKEMAFWVKSWTQLNPDWEYWFWTPQNVHALLKKHYPQLLDMYNSYPYDVQRADAMRYIVLYHFGGLYADLDMECLKPMAFWADRFSCVLSEEPHAHNLLYSEGKGNVLNAFLMCRAGHPLYKQLLDNLNITAKSALIKNFQDILYTTGPFFVENTLHQYLESGESSNQGKDVLTVSSAYFLPTFDEKQRKPLFNLCQNELYSPNRDRVHVHSVCQDLVKRNFTNVPVDVSFANHFWYHTWWDERRWKKRSEESIFNIVSNVRTFH